MSYFPGLKLTKKGEELLAKINGNLSETITFKKGELGSGEITGDDEIRFLTSLKKKWKDVNISDIKIINNEDAAQVQIELQFDNADITENQIFREIGLYASGNDDETILFAYSNAKENYDYIPAAIDNPQSFIINVLLTITSNTKVNANIDLNSYVSLKKFNEELAKKQDKTDNSLLTVAKNIVGSINELYTDLSKKASKSVLGRMIVGKGMTVDTTGKVSIISKNDGIIVNDNDIQLETINNLTTNSITKPLSAAQGLILDKQDKGLAGGYAGSFPLTSAVKDGIYLLPATGKFYVCTTAYSGSSLTAPNSNFEELSVFQNRNRLENLSITGSLKENGYMYIGSLLIQWGIARITEGQTGSGSFPIQFPHNIFSITTNDQWIESYGDIGFCITANKSSWSATARKVGSCKYIAIGY